MVDLERAPCRPLSASQAAVLAAMEVDVYQRRRMPALAQAEDTLAVAEAVVPANWLESESRLALALARATGVGAVVGFCALWAGTGLALPDLARLRSDPAGKRALWRQLRQLLRQ